MLGALGSPRYWLGELALLEGDVDEADRRFSEQLAIVRAANAWRGIRLGSMGMAKVALRRGDAAAARSALDEVRQRARVLGDVADPAYLECAAELLIAEGRPEAAARVLGAAEAHRTAMGAPLPPAYRASHQHLVSEIASHLDKEPVRDCLGRGSPGAGAGGPRRGVRHLIGLVASQGSRQPGPLGPP